MNLSLSYEELEKRSELLDKESGEKIRKTLTETIIALKGLRYSEIEMFLLLLERETKRGSTLGYFTITSI